MAYVKQINKNSTDSHQTSVGYVVTVLRWSNRDTKNYKGAGEEFQALNTRKPLVIISDIINLQVTSSKSSYIPNMSCTMMGGDINYSTAIHPGDIVLVNLLDSQEKVINIYERALALRQINKYDDGFKGIFKVQHIERRIQTTGDGTRIVSYGMQAAGFTEFNNVINYNPVVAAAFAGQSIALYQVLIGNSFSELTKESPSCQNIIKTLYKSLLGVNSVGKTDVKIKQYGNHHFKMPTGLSGLLGRSIIYASDLYSLQVGIWPASSGGSTSSFITNFVTSKLDLKKENSSNLINVKNIAAGFNPGIKQDNSNSTIYKTEIPIDGTVKIAPESWNGQTSWSIIKSYSNESINEMFTSFKVDIKGNVSPVVIVRQKPFNKQGFKSNYRLSFTKFLSLPRWKISSDLMFDVSTAKEESLRFNFVQVFSNSRIDSQNEDHADQVTANNFKLDGKDIQRHGLKPYIIQSNANYYGSDKQGEEAKAYKSPAWAELVSDWVMGGELKEHITISYQGIVDPIAVGENLEFEGVVYHIESIAHVYSVASNGSKMFRTNIQGSHGISLESEKSSTPVYAQMDHTDAFTERKENFDKGYQTMPGFSDTEDLPIRSSTAGEEIAGLSETKEKSFTLRKPK